MAYEKGISGNPTGRKPGTPNKATTAAREVISAALASTDAATLQAKLAALDGKDFIDAYVKLAEFITPKLQRTALAAEETKGPMQVTLHIGRRTPEERDTYRLNNEQAALRLLS